jgi:hypothetical protein
LRSNTSVDERHVDVAQLDQLAQRRAVAVELRELHVEAGLEGAPRGLALRRGDAVVRHQQPGGAVVGDDGTGEAELTAQQIV